MCWHNIPYKLPSTTLGQHPHWLGSPTLDGSAGDLHPDPFCQRRWTGWPTSPGKNIEKSSKSMAVVGQLKVGWIWNNGNPWFIHGLFSYRVSQKIVATKMVAPILINHGLINHGLPLATKNSWVMLGAGMVYHFICNIFCWEGLQHEYWERVNETDHPGPGNIYAVEVATAHPSKQVSGAHHHVFPMGNRWNVLGAKASRSMNC